MFRCETFSNNIVVEEINIWLKTAIALLLACICLEMLKHETH